MKSFENGGRQRVSLTVLPLIECIEHRVVNIVAVSVGKSQHFVCCFLKILFNMIL